MNAPTRWNHRPLARRPLLWGFVKKLDMVVFLLDGSTMTFFQGNGEMDLEWMFDKHLWNKGRWWERKARVRGYSAWMRGTVPGRADHSCHQAWAGTGQGATPLAGRTLTKSPGQTCVPPFAEKRLPVTCNNWSKSRVFPGCGIFSATTGCGKPGQLITFLSESYPGFRFSSKG